ncbi:hypothetical protein [Enhydrobacter aerosaccus]|nr:hypothetical protein [Enhydrobacter aerosaccus]
MFDAALGEYMRRIWKLGFGFAGLGLLAMAGALLVVPGIAAANPFFANQTGQPCTACHVPGQEQKGLQGLNAAGQAFKNCGFKVGCTANGATQTKTTEHNDGLATFTNTCSAGQTRWVVLRPGLNDASRDIALMLDPGSRQKVAVSKGTTYAAACGNAPGNGQQFFWIRLDLAM